MRVSHRESDPPIREQAMTTIDQTVKPHVTYRRGEVRASELRPRDVILRSDNAWAEVLGVYTPAELDELLGRPDIHSPIDRQRLTKYLGPGVTGFVVVHHQRSSDRTSSR